MGRNFDELENMIPHGIVDEVLYGIVCDVLFHDEISEIVNTEKLFVVDENELVVRKGPCYSCDDFLLAHLAENRRLVLLDGIFALCSLALELVNLVERRLVENARPFVFETILVVDAVTMKTV